MLSIHGCAFQPFIVEVKIPAPDYIAMSITKVKLDDTLNKLENLMNSSYI